MYRFHGPQRKKLDIRHGWCILGGVTAKEIQRAREILGMTREEFAQAVKTTARTVYRWELGETSPQPVFVHAIRSLLKDTLEAQPVTAGSQK